MAVIEESHKIEELPRTNLSGLSIQYRNETQEILHRSRTGLPSRPIQDEENSPLLRNTQRHGCCEKVKSRFKSRRCCIRSSKAALLILFWNLIVSCGISSFLDPNLYNSTLYIRRADGTVVIEFSVYNLAFLYGFRAFLFLFYPLAGCLADIRWGRYKTVVNSLCLGFWGVVSVIVLGSLTVIGFIPSMVYGIPDKMNAIQVTTIATLSIVFGVPIFCGVVLVLCSLTAFSANVIQFGLDQLHDAPTDDSVLYIHWYVWTCYVGVFNVHLPLLTQALSEDAGTLIIRLSFVLYGVTIALALSLLGVTLCVQRYKRNWFLIESGFGNPYKLVFKVMKFAKEHSHPIRRSAFTYCEDELPSRIDLGKEKYGGPFTTEEVENVKAFGGILSVLLTLGPIFMADNAIHGILQSLASNAYIRLYYINAVYFENGVGLRKIIYGSGSITSLIIVIVIPLYLGLLRPFIHDYIPGMLKRIGLGMILLVLSGLCTLVMGSVGQHCVYTGNSTALYGCENSLVTYFQLDPNFLLIQSFLNALGYMFLYIATYEFICAQSPHSMKGLLIGTFFTVKGVFQLLGVVVLYFPFVYARPFSDQGKFPLHGFIYYLINIVIGMVGIVAFVIVSRKYQYRQRDEPDNIYRYAEEYYAKSQEERNYDYDDYSNLNCETIRE